MIATDVLNREIRKSFLGSHEHPEKPSVRNWKLIILVGSSTVMLCLSFNQWFRFGKGHLCQDRKPKRNSLCDAERRMFIN